MSDVPINLRVLDSAALAGPMVKVKEKKRTKTRRKLKNLTPFDFLNLNTPFPKVRFSSFRFAENRDNLSLKPPKKNFN